MGSPATADAAPATTTYVTTDAAPTMVAYPSYPGMIPQAYMPSFSAGMVTPTITGTGTGAAPAVAGETSAVPNVDQTAVKAATKMAAKKKKKISGDKKKAKKGCC